MLLRKVAAQMGGRAFFPSREEQLPDVHALIATEAYSRYVITYTPTNQEWDGAYRAIRLAVGEPSYTVKARPGYFAPAPPPIRPTLEFSAAGDSEAILALAASDVTVLEDGVPQQIESFQEANAPMSIVMALDASGSMRPALDAVKAAATTFVQALRPADPLALVQFSDRVVVEHELSTRRQLTLDAIAGRRRLAAPRSGTPSTTRWPISGASRAARHRRVDRWPGREQPGLGAGQRTPWRTCWPRCATPRPRSTRSGWGHEWIAKVVTGGRGVGRAAYFPEDVSQLADRYRRVVDDLRAISHHLHLDEQHARWGLARGRDHHAATRTRSSKRGRVQRAGPCQAGDPGAVRGGSMRIGGASRDSMMTLIPVSVAVLVAMALLGGPEDALRMLERLGYDAWMVVGSWFLN
jgi:hypothetical protein